MYRKLLSSLGCCCLVLVVGCNDGRIPTTPVSGKVTLDGKPLSDCTITFLPQAESTSNPIAGVASAAKTGPDGNYTLSTSDGRKGAVVATHTVRIRPAEGGDLSNPDDPGRSPKKVMLPRNAMDGSLKFNVPEGGTKAADFALSTDR